MKYPGRPPRLWHAPLHRYARPTCGRIRLAFDVSEIKIVFSIPPHRPTPIFPPSWNAAPTDLLRVVRYDRRGLIPHWAKDINVGFANINAKAEGDREQAGLPRCLRTPPMPGAV
jgi:hypothetical protein